MKPEIKEGIFIVLFLLAIFVSAFYLTWLRPNLEPYNSYYCNGKVVSCKYISYDKGVTLFGCEDGVRYQCFEFKEAD